jgi:maltose-binding protein MalE
MIYNRSLVFILVAILAAVPCACAGDSDTVKSGEEESGIELALDEIYDDVRNGARLILTYDAKNNAFKGTVENTTEDTLEQVRVEVHLSNGMELGPTTPTDLNPGDTMDVMLDATDNDFDGWTAHPEVGEGGNGEHSSGGGESEHGGESESEHNEGGSE